MGAQLWKPTKQRVAEATITEFASYVSKRWGIALHDFNSLHQWSVNNSENFWQAIWDFCDVQASRPATTIVQHKDRTPGARWFADAQLNYTENLLRRKDDRLAIIFRGEDKPDRAITYSQLSKHTCLLYTSPSPRDRTRSRMPSSA